MAVTSPELRRKNVRTALILASLAFAFLFGFVIRRYFE
jgi:hypothetical protein